MSRPVKRERAPWFFSAALCLWWWWPAVAPAEEAPAERLERARLEYSYKNFANAAALLEGLLHPSVQLASEDDILAAREMLGLCYFYLGREAEARQEFISLLYLRPAHRLDPFLIPPPAVAFFDGIRAEPELAKELREIEERRRPPKEPVEERVRLIVRERDVEVRKRWMMFLPFGVGQFANNETLKGALFATGQGVALAGNVICYSLLVGLANENGRYAAGDRDLARGLRVGQYVSLGLFLAVWAAGALEANLSFAPYRAGPWREAPGEPAAGGAGLSLAPGGLSLTWAGRW